MGAARKRGTFAERALAAYKRNRRLQWAIENGKDEALKVSLKRVGIRRVHATLVQNQVIID